MATKRNKGLRCKYCRRRVPAGEAGGACPDCKAVLQAEVEAFRVVPGEPRGNIRFYNTRTGSGRRY